MSRSKLRKINEDREVAAISRRARIMKLAAEGKTPAVIAKMEGCALQTVYNNRSIARNEAGPRAEEIRNEADEALLKLLVFITSSEEMTDKEIVDSVRGVWKDRRDLHGADAPTRNENLNLSGELESLGPYRQFVLACRGLEQEQIEQVLTVARELPRKPAVMIQPPKTSPLWLEDGHETS